MNMHKIISGLFFTLAMTLNFGFFYGDPTQLGAVLLATSLVADIQLIASATVWAFAEYVAKNIGIEATTAIVSLSGGALLANTVSVILFIGDTIKSKR